MSCKLEAIGRCASRGANRGPPRSACRLRSPRATKIRNVPVMSRKMKAAAAVDNPSTVRCAINAPIYPRHGLARRGMPMGRGHSHRGESASIRRFGAHARPHMQPRSGLAFSGPECVNDSSWAPRTSAPDDLTRSFHQILTVTSRLFFRFRRNLDFRRQNANVDNRLQSRFGRHG